MVPVPVVPVHTLGVNSVGRNLTSCLSLILSPYQVWVVLPSAAPYVACSVYRYTVCVLTTGEWTSSHGILRPRHPRDQRDCVDRSASRSHQPVTSRHMSNLLRVGHICSRPRGDLSPSCERRRTRTSQNPDSEAMVCLRIYEDRYCASFILSLSSLG